MPWTASFVEVVGLFCGIKVCINVVLGSFFVVYQSGLWFCYLSPVGLHHEQFPKPISPSPLWQETIMCNISVVLCTAAELPPCSHSDS